MDDVLSMSRACLLPCLFLLLLLVSLPVCAHVPVSVGDNNALSTAFVVEKPTKSYAIYSHLHDTGNVAYYQFPMDRGDQLVLSLMTNGYNAPVPDMIVISPGYSGGPDDVLQAVTVPPGYSAEVINGHQPVTAVYEPFSPGAIFEVASYKKEITIPGTYYVAITSPVKDTSYSLAVGYLEEFSPAEWVLVPVNLILTRFWEGQSIVSVFAPFLAVVFIGYVYLARRKNRRCTKSPSSCWLAESAGLFYFGGAAVTLVQMARAVSITGVKGTVAVTLLFALVPLVLGIWALRIGRLSYTKTQKDRISLAVIGLLGLLFWAGLLIGPVAALVAAVLPDRNIIP
jgi:hypothetical protein